VHPPDLLHEHQILPGARRGLGRIGALRDVCAFRSIVITDSV
jgi:hypothetical protein